MPSMTFRKRLRVLRAAHDYIKLAGRLDCSRTGRLRWQPVKDPLCTRIYHSGIMINETHPTGLNYILPAEERLYFMNHYSNGATETLYQLFLDTHAAYESHYIDTTGNRYLCNGKEYSTVSAIFKALSYEEIQYDCAVWTGIESGAITYEALVEYADEFAIAIPTMAQYNALLEDEDDDAAYEMVDKACEKVLEAIADGLIDTWHSSCVIRGKRSKTQK